MATPNTLLIEKDGNNKFRHTHNGLPLTKFSISDYDCSFDGTKFKIIEKDGASRYDYDVTNITIKDNTAGGTPENYPDPLQCEDRLRQLQYTPYKSATGIEEAPIDGNEYVRKDGGWVLASGSGGGSGFSKIVVWDGTSTITVPAGFSGSILNYNNGEIVTYTIAGTNLTITGAAEGGNTLILTTE